MRMGRKRTTPFDPKIFRTKVDGGKAIFRFRMKHAIFSQEVKRPMRCSLFSGARSSSLCFLPRAKRPSSRFWNRRTFWVNPASPGN
jgi:hypothetical protein